MRKGLPDFLNMKLEFGTYVQLFNDNKPSNTMAPRRSGAIALGPLGPLGNSKNDYYFLSLPTGNRLCRNNYTPLPMTDAVIKQVEYLASLDDMPPFREDQLWFERRPGDPVPDPFFIPPACVLNIGHMH